MNSYPCCKYVVVALSIYFVMFVEGQTSDPGAVTKCSGYCSADATTHYTLNVDGTCLCHCRNQFQGLQCEQCPFRFAGSLCNMCSYGRVSYPTCEVGTTLMTPTETVAPTINCFTSSVVQLAESSSLKEDCSNADGELDFRKIENTCEALECECRQGIYDAFQKKCLSPRQQRQSSSCASLRCLAIQRECIMSFLVSSANFSCLSSAARITKRRREDCDLSAQCGFCTEKSNLCGSQPWKVASSSISTSASENRKNTVLRIAVFGIVLFILL